ncbi:unnamed protein product [Angiostrongylus costaricensis]|uniref:BPI2 domain-containing protein n=1 Tax=Angiostrongylus costaricensis TaxID=334426 RepID=A0A0R3PCP7_ANGCS|nr:unnamed protein product [Angiostrongylus costaricensis]
MPQILNNMHLPDVSVSLATISKIHINRVERPAIQAKFVRDKGKWNAKMMNILNVDTLYCYITFILNVIKLQMIGILLTDKVPNTFFSHIFANRMGIVHHRQPRVEISGKDGVRVELAGNVLIQFNGRDDLYNLIHANTKLHVTLKPTIRRSQLYGDVSLTHVDVRVFDLGVGGMLSKPIEKLVSFVVPRVLWPQVKKRIRFAFNKRGIQLPVVCGVTLDHLSLSYIDHAAVVNTDFTFDLPLFVHKFKLYLIKKAEMFNGLPTYVEI